jgi:hypothetical protein
MRNNNLLMKDGEAYVDGQERLVNCVETSPEKKPTFESGGVWSLNGNKCYFIDYSVSGSANDLPWYCIQWTADGTSFPCGDFGDNNGEYTFSNCTADTAPMKYTGGTECVASGLNYNVTDLMCHDPNTQQNCLNTLEYDLMGEYQWPCYTLVESEVTINCGDSLNYGYPCPYMASLCGGHMDSLSHMLNFCTGLKTWCQDSHDELDSGKVAAMCKFA